MALAPRKALLNIMKATRGLIDFKPTQSEEVSQPKSFGTRDFITPEVKSRILRTISDPQIQRSNHSASPANHIMSMMTSSYHKVGQDRMENRRILQLMPDVRKAARLMVASIFSPGDLSRHEIAVKVDIDSLDTTIANKLNDALTEFFQKNLSLKTEAPSWVYQFGYETGASIFAILPFETFNKFNDEMFIGTENVKDKVIDVLCEDSLFGFGDPNNVEETRREHLGLESFAGTAIKDNVIGKTDTHPDINTDVYKKLVESFIGKETLSLTDNPSVLQTKSQQAKRRARYNSRRLKEKFKQPTHEPILELTSADGNELEGNPVLFKLPPEAVTIVHTPGDPDDHQGYLVLLDITGNPVDVVTQENDGKATDLGATRRSNDIFSQVNSAYGFTSNGTRSAMDKQTMEAIHSQIVSKHIRQRLDKAGYNEVDIPNIDITMRHLFTRMLREKRTRILFLPKDLVTYMTFEKDQFGYGVSRLNSIKFVLGMKMAVQVSRVLAAIKAATDKRLLTLKFGDDMLEQPEQMVETLIQQFIQKEAITFSTDPSSIQSQIQQKSFSIKTENVPGMEDFSVSNEPDNRSGASDFDPAMTEYLDKQIINGLDVPASTMNSLNEDEYARSVTTTNLFFAMEVSIYQDIVIRLISDLIRKYARFSKEFQEVVFKILPELKPSSTSSTDEESPDNTKLEKHLPDNMSFTDFVEKIQIALPQPNIAPSKAHFESLDSMVSSMTAMMNSLFPDELVGPDDKLRPVIGLLRSRFISTNIRNYLESSGMSGVELPNETRFSDQLSDLSELHDGLQNIASMWETKMKLAQTEPTETPAPGY